MRKGEEGVDAVVAVLAVLVSLPWMLVRWLWRRWRAGRG